MRDPFRRPFTILNAKKATGIGNNIYVGECQHATITIVVAGQGSGDVITAKLKVSIAATLPDFSAAATAANLWNYAEMTNQSDTSGNETIVGSDGVSFSNQNETRSFEVNLNGTAWLNLDVTTYTDGNTSGSITAYIRLFKNT